MNVQLMLELISCIARKIEANLFLHTFLVPVLLMYMRVLY